MPVELHGVMDALRELSPNQRAVVVLRHVHGLETEEVADRMGIALPTVRGWCGVCRVGGCGRLS
jgi:DNA-directed RNA polymerase specialized sigma24 family protein